MLIGLHKDGDNLHHQQRKEFLRIIICNLKMDGRNMPILPNVSLKLPGVSPKQTRERANKMNTKFSVMDRKKNTHLQVADEDSLCWRKLYSLFEMVMVTKLMNPLSHTGITSATHPYPLVIH